jgi:hypothetical protein
VPARQANDSEPNLLMKFHHAVERSEKPAWAARWLVVIDHHEARIFRSCLHGTVAEQIRPDQADDSISHVHSFDGFSRGQEKPVPGTFFGPVAEALKEAGGILIFGSGTGTASAMDQFVTWLKTHRPEQARRIVGERIIDAHHLTDAQLLAKARDFHAHSGVPSLPTQSRGHGRP